MLFLLAATIWVVNGPVVNLHSGPSKDAGVSSQAIYGARVEQVRKKGAWLEIRTVDEYSGWVHKSGLKKMSGKAGDGVATLRVDTLAAHLYREPDVTKHAPVLTLPYEAALEVAREVDERWVEVRLVDGKSAYVQRGDVAASQGPLPVDAVALLSRRFLGLPYTWGGASSFGFDCSGFTQMLCRRRGIGIPRDSRPQSEWAGAMTVPRGELAPGDLLFFGPEPGRINHTGFYLGNGEFIHATAYQKPRIQVSRLDDPHWSELLRVCRRPKEGSKQ